MRGGRAERRRTYDCTQSVVRGGSLTYCASLRSDARLMPCVEVVEPYRLKYMLAWKRGKSRGQRLQLRRRSPSARKEAAHLRVAGDDGRAEHLDEDRRVDLPARDGGERRQEGEQDD